MRATHWALLLLLVTAACTAPYVEPWIDPAGGKGVDPSDLIPYRPLVRADFQAKELPQELQGKHVGAGTALFVYATPCSIRVAIWGQWQELHYEAHVDTFRYQVRVNRAKSWWDPKRNKNERYYLDHEQTHFAIAEIAIRDANAHIDEIRDRIRSSAGTRDEAMELAQKRFKEELALVHKEVFARNAMFDKNSANGQDRYENNRWVKLIKKELAESAVK